MQAFPELLRFLSGIELFEDLEENERTQLAGIVQEQHLPAGAPVFVENTPRQGLILIHAGEIELFKRTPFGDEKRLAVKLSKICNGLRLLSSGPRAGLFEINLPPMQPGSSIMPGKVNPVIPEVINQIAFKVIGNDLTVTLGAEAG